MHGPDDMNGVYAMQGIVTLLLVVVCLNVAVLVYTRTAMRQRKSLCARHWAPAEPYWPTLYQDWCCPPWRPGGLGIARSRSAG
jgi:hypothetical protein